MYLIFSRCFVISILFFLQLSGCIRDEQNKPSPTKELIAKKDTITATTGMIKDIVGQIVKDRIEVKALMGPGTDPHLYKASERDIRLLAESNLILYNGLHLEGKIGEILERLARKKSVVAVSERIPADRLRKPEGMRGNYDPHIWFDILLWIMATERIRDAIIDIHPGDETFYRKNTDLLIARLAELHRWTIAKIDTIPEHRRVLVTAHDAFGYFGRTYGLEVKAIQGLSTEDEAGVMEINALVDFIADRGIRSIFIESSVSPKNIRALIEGSSARGSDVRIGGELFSDAMGEEGTPEGTYEGMIRHNVEKIVEALH